MQDAEFWALIDRSREEAGDDVNAQAVRLEAHLGELGRIELKRFDRTFMRLWLAAYRWDIWGAGTILAKGMSDDTFMDFRNWLISRGRTVYETALADPDSLAALPDIVSPTYVAEDIGGAANNAYEAKYGVELLDDDPDEGETDEERALDAALGSGALRGTRWEEQDLPVLFPRLTALVGWP